MRKSIIVVSFLLCAAMLLGLAAPGVADIPVPQGIASGEKVTLEFLTTINEEWEVKYNAMFDDIMRRYPNVEISYNKVASTTSGIGWDGFNQKFLSMMAAGTPPDLIYAGVAFIPQYSRQGMLTELDELIENMANEADYISDSLRLLEQPDGKVYAIGDGIGSIMMYYNKDLFDKHGLEYPSYDYENAYTMEQFEHAARTIAEGEGADRVFGAYINLHLERSTPLLFGYGGDVFNEDMTKCLLDEQPSLDAYTMMIDLIKEGIAPNSAQLKAMPANQMFMTNKIGMYFGPCHDTENLVTAANEAGLRFGVAATPHVEGVTSETFLFLDGFAVPKGVKNAENSFWLIQQLLGEECGEIAFDLAKPAVIVLNQALSDKMKDKMYAYLTDEEKSVWYDAPEHCKLFPFNPGWSKVVDVSTSLFDLMAIGEMSIEDGMKQMTAEIDAILASEQ